MIFVKKMLKSYACLIISLLVFSFIGTLFNYFDVINGKVMSICNFMVFIFSMGLGGFVIGKNALKNGWLEGFKIGIIFILIILVFNLIFIHDINMKSVIFYIILIISSTIGSMFGINKKEK